MTAGTARPAPAVGERAPERTYGPLSTRDFVRYSGASGDLNPMHYDADAARAAGFPGVFSQGMHSAALVAGFATDWLGAENVRRFAVRFSEQVWPGDVLTCTGTVLSVTPDPEGSQVEVELCATRPGGGVAITASASFLIPRTR